jgi:hypothetical protein
VGRFIAQNVDTGQSAESQVKQGVALIERYRNLLKGNEADPNAVDAILSACTSWNSKSEADESGAIAEHSTADIERLIDLWEYKEKFRDPLREVLKAIREYLASTINAQIIISGNSGHSPGAALNFFLLRSREDRVNALDRWNKAGKVVEDHDKTQDRHIKGLYDVVQNSHDTNTDPSARLVRYPGHFVPMHVTDANLDEAVVTMHRQIETVLNAQFELKTKRKELIDLFALDRQRNGTGAFSLLLLKGGGFDRFYGSVNAAILRRLTEENHFHVFLGSRTNVSLDHALIRWNFLEERMVELKRQLEPEQDQREGEENLRELLKEVVYLMQIRDHWRLHNRLQELDSCRREGSVEVRQKISKALTFLRYVTTSSQYVLLQRRVTREKITLDWGLNKRDLLDARRRVEKNNYFDVRMLPSLDAVDENLQNHPELVSNFLSRFDEQEFVKLILTGSAGEDLERGNHLRGMVWAILSSKPHGWFEGLIEPDLSIDAFASIVNGVHGPNGPRGIDRELQKEILLLPLEDVVLFSNAMRSALEAGV